MATQTSVTLSRSRLSRAATSLSPTETAVLLALLADADPRTARVWGSPRQLGQTLHLSERVVLHVFEKLRAERFLTCFAEHASGASGMDLTGLIERRKAEPPEDLPVVPPV